MKTRRRLILPLIGIILTLGMLLGGVIEIYGTDNHLLIVYPILGLLLFASALIVRLIAVLDHPP